MYILSLIAVVLASNGAVFAQEKSVAGKPAPSREYRLQALYRPGIAQNYLIQFRDTVSRMHSQGAGAKEYTRSVDYFATIRCIESVDNVSTILVNLDSMQYAFTSDGQTVSYDSQIDIAPKNFLDLNNYIAILNRTVEIGYNPYGEIRGIGGENLQWIREYIGENGSSLDSVSSLIWTQAVGDVAVAAITDLQKRVIPGKRVAVDSSWKHSFQTRVDNIDVGGMVRTTFDTYGGGFYTLRTVDTLQVQSGIPFHVYGITDICRVVDGSVAFDNVLDITTTGAINRLEQRARGRIRGRIMNEVFTSDIRSSATWTLKGQFQW